MRIVRLLSVVLTLVMGGVIVYGLVSGDFGGEANVLLGLAWGQVTLVDLYVGLIIFGTWVAVRETSWLVRIAWWVGFILLGNLATAIYLMVASFTSEDPEELMFGV